MKFEMITSIKLSSLVYYIPNVRCESLVFSLALTKLLLLVANKCVCQVNRKLVTKTGMETQFSQASKIVLLRLGKMTK